MSYLLTNFWSRDSMYDGLKIKLKTSANFFNFHTILLHFALLDINNLFTTLDQLPVNYVRKGFLVPVIVPRKNIEKRKSTKFKYRFFQLLLPSWKNQSVRRPNSSVDGS